MGQVTEPEIFRRGQVLSCHTLYTLVCSLFLDGPLATLTGSTGGNRLHVEHKYYTWKGQQKLKRLQLDISCEL